LFFILFLLLPNLYAAIRTYSLWPWAMQHAFAYWIVAIFFILIQMLGIFGERSFFHDWKNTLGPLVPVINWAAYTLYGFVSILVAYFLIAEIVRIIVYLSVTIDEPVSFDRRLFLTFGLGAAATTAFGVWQAANGPIVKRVTIPLKNLPSAYDGFTIAQISDLHVGPTIRRRYVQNVVNITNALNPDLIALTGDFVDGSVEELSPDVAPLRDLKSRYGSFYVTGNHEYYSGAAQWISHFKTLGIRVLENEHAVIQHNGASLLIAGVNDYSTLSHHAPRRCNPAASLEGAPEGLVKILLAHQPVTYMLSEPAGFDLQLSGHTHAGQYFPFNLLIPFFQKYYKGLNRHNNMWIYVNSATGYWGPPLRAAVPTEITLITLRTSNNENL
jgi:uncharacterized protein